MAKWLQSTSSTPLPAHAFVGGYDSDGSIIYVGRSYHEGKYLPAMVLAGKRTAYVTWAGVEYSKSHYDILVGENYTWQACFGADVPPNAISAGEIVCGSEPIFIGRGHYGNSLVVGRIQPSHACLYIPFMGGERKLEKYEILVYGAAAAAGSSAPRNDLIKFDCDDSSHSWIQMSAYAGMPPDAVMGGSDKNGDVIYVGRVFHEGDMLVANVIPAKQIAFVSFRGTELPKDRFEILCGKNLVWRHCYNHIIPNEAVLCGKTSLGQPVYIGRGHYEGSLAVGKISSVHKALFIPFNGVERRLETYEILVKESMTVGWQVSTLVQPLPSPTVPIASELSYAQAQRPLTDPPPPYVAAHTSMPIPSTLPNYPPTSSSGFPRPIHKYPSPVPAATYTAPPQHFPKPLTTCCMPPRPSSYNVWVPAHAGNMPGNAVHAGHDVDMNSIYVCRSYDGGDLLPGKAVPARACAYVSLQGQEIEKSSYEVLTGHNYIWVAAVNGFAAGAVQGGRTAGGEPLYIGRAHYNGSLTCGKIHRSHNCLYIPFGGREVKIGHGYEILVDRNLRNRDWIHN